MLGISMGTYDNYNVLIRYPGVLTAYEKGLTRSFVNVKKIILNEEQRYKTQHAKTQLSITDKKAIENRVIELLMGEDKKTSQTRIKLKNISSTKTAKALLTQNLTELDVGISWHELDWTDASALNSALNKVIEFLEASTGK